MWLVSCAFNVLLFLLICIGMQVNAGWIRVSFGQPSLARSALFSMYAVGLIFSILMLLRFFPTFAVPLLIFNISFAIVVPFTYWNIRHPIIVTHLVLAAVHCVTVYQLWDNYPIPIT